MKQVIFTTLFVKEKNPVHARKDVSKDLAGYIREWHLSMTINKVNAIIFHDGLPEDLVESFTNEYVKFKQVPEIRHNACDARWMVYAEEVKNIEPGTYIFCNDISDVVMGGNPFVENAGLADGILYTGDEPAKLKHPWIQKRNEDLVDKLPEVYEFIKNNTELRTLNPGIIGGSYDIMKEYFTIMAEHLERGGYIAKTIDMSIHNYVARTYFDGRLKHGAPVNSTFGRQQKNRKDVWFIHK